MGDIVELRHPVLAIESIVKGTLANIEKILRIEAEIRKLPQVEFPVTHHFIDDLYAREMHIPAGGVLVGRVHHYGCVNVISKGDISVLTDDGLTRITAPCTVVSSAGVKRFGFAHEATIWTSIHRNPNKITDIGILEDILGSETYDGFLTHHGNTLE
jgi:hypothetical protein